MHSTCAWFSKRCLHDALRTHSRHCPGTIGSCMCLSPPLFGACNLALVSAHAPNVTLDRAPRVDEYWHGTCGICGGGCKSAVTMLPHHLFGECGREAQGPSDHVLGVPPALNSVCMYVYVGCSLDRLRRVLLVLASVSTSASPLCHSRTILPRLVSVLRERRNTAARQTEG